MKIRLRRGFTLTELVITLFLLSTFLGFITFSLVNSQRTTSLEATIETLLSDFRSQQVKAMVGNTDGRTTSDDYGIYFASSSYTLFHGTTFDPSDTANMTVTLDPQFQITPSGVTVLFSRVTGEVSGYSSSSNTITISDSSSGVTKTMTFNALGVPVNLN